MFYQRVKMMAGLACATCVLSCSQQPKADESARIPVKTMMADAREYTGSRSYVGTVEESFGSQLSFATMGTVSKVLVEEGQAVKKGQVLAVLDKTSAESSFQIARSTLHQAQDAFNRLQTLYNKGSLPEIKYIEIQTQLAQAQAGVRIAGKNLDDCVLHAPFSGYISQKMVDIGNNVVPGVGCFRLVKIDGVKVKVSVPEQEISGISKGADIGFTVAALGNRHFVGKVVEKGVQANALSHTYEIKIILPNPNHDLLPGMVCSVEMNTDDAGRSILVPQEAVMLDGESTYVWIVEHGEAVKRPVKAGGVTNQGVIIADGLAHGEKIIVSGQNKVSEGTKIKEL